MGSYPLSTDADEDPVLVTHLFLWSIDAAHVVTGPWAQCPLGVSESVPLGSTAPPLQGSDVIVARRPRQPINRLQHNAAERARFDALGRFG